MKRSYLSNTYWHTNTLHAECYSSRKSHWGIVDEDYLYTSDWCDVRTYKIIRKSE